MNAKLRLNRGLPWLLVFPFVAAAQVSSVHLKLDSPVRLSQWLKDQGQTLQGTEPLGLGWTTPQERDRQKLSRDADVAWLHRALLNPGESLVWNWLAQSHVTGRVVLSAAVTPWLEGVPVRDPVLRPGDGLWTMPAGLPVQLMDGSGTACTLAHQPGAWVADYLAACGWDGAEEVWVAQPDGRVKAYPLGSWQPALQTQLAPGALVWMGWPRTMFKSSVTPLELGDINRRTATWLALASPSSRPQGLSELRQVRAVTLPQMDSDWLGLKGQRFVPQPSSSNWGVVGLMQTPTARMRPEGSFSLSWMNTRPHAWLNVMLQPFEWLEGGFRYVSVSNRRYGPADFSGDQSYKDKSFEVKVRLAKESPWMPELAVGIRDLGGTGLFGGEYLVASKRWGRLDASLGLGWGYLGSKATLANPLGVVDGAFNNRVKSNSGSGGTVDFETYFRGRVAPFGGVEYQSPWGPVFKVEYNGNNYRNEPQNNNLPVSSALNYGLVYRWAPGVDVHVSWERGNTLGVGLSLATDLSGLSMPKMTDKPLPPVSLQYPKKAPDWDQTRSDIENFTNWEVRQLVQEGGKLGVVVSRSQDTYLEPRLERVMRVVQRDAPSDVLQVEVQHWGAGGVLAVDKMDRARWLQSLTEPARTAAPVPWSDREWPQDQKTTDQEKLLSTGTDKAYSLSPGLSFRQSLGGPDAFMLYKLSLTLAGQAQLPMAVRLNGQLELRTLSNYDLFKFKGGGTDLPRVRTYLREYETQSRMTLPRLYAVRDLRLSKDLTAAFYGGLLESMFGGAGGELLYRPAGSSFALGVDVNRVQQRDFGQDFKMRDYKADTGHLTAYWETPWDGLVGALSVGQYLAGDRGVTLRATKTFNNGTSMGVFATKTNLSAQQFGEGSFNKGVFWSIPFDAFMTSSSRLRANFNWVPLTRDGGAMLNRPYRLHDETAPLSPRASVYAPAVPKQRIPDDLR